jgi:hypothetical protein
MAHLTNANSTIPAHKKNQYPKDRAAKENVPLLFHGNAAGNLVKLGLLYRAAYPCALQGEDRKLLPLFWQSNKKAWVMPA